MVVVRVVVCLRLKFMMMVGQLSLASMLISSGIFPLRSSPLMQIMWGRALVVRNRVNCLVPLGLGKCLLLGILVWVLVSNLVSVLLCGSGCTLLALMFGGTIATWLVCAFIRLTMMFPTRLEFVIMLRYLRRSRVVYRYRVWPLCTVHLSLELRVPIRSGSLSVVVIGVFTRMRPVTSRLVGLRLCTVWVPVVMKVLSLLWWKLLSSVGLKLGQWLSMNIGNCLGNLGWIMRVFLRLMLSALGLR